MTITTQNTVTPAPTATLKKSINNGTYSIGDANININDSVSLQWNSTNATSCIGSGSGFYTLSTSGEDTSITEPTAGNSTTYTVECSGSGGTASSSLTITTLTSSYSQSNYYNQSSYYNQSNYYGGYHQSSYSTPAPTATLKKSINGSAYSTSSATIKTNDSVSLQWNSTNATDCSGTNFIAGGNISGEDTTIITPTPGNFIIYTVECSGPGGTASDHLTITNISPTATLKKSINNDAYSRGDATININDSISLQWNSTNATSCTGSSFDTGYSTSGTATNIIEPIPHSSVTYTINCSGLSGTATDSLTITTESDAPYIRADKTLVRQNDFVQLEWSTGSYIPSDPNTTCTLSGYGLSNSDLTNIVLNGEKTIQIPATVTFSLWCNVGINPQEGNDEIVRVDDRYIVQ